MNLTLKQLAIVDRALNSSAHEQWKITQIDDPYMAEPAVYQIELIRTVQAEVRNELRKHTVDELKAEGLSYVLN